MLPAVLVAVVAAIGPVLPPDPPAAISVVPDEPDAFVLPEAATYQAVAADLDGDGAREIVRLVAGQGAAIEAEAWAQDADGWSLLGRIEVVPPSPPGGAGVVNYAGAPVRLLVRHAGGRDLVTLARQPEFRELDLEGGCCLLLGDLRLEGGLRLADVADPAVSVDAVFAIDLDGDGTDELVTTRSLPPLGDITFPTEAAIYRWSGEGFTPPVATELGVGSGDLPFVLGDSDDRPGDELAVITRVSTGRLYRISLRDGDELVTEDTGIAAADARAVPIGEGRGIAVIDNGGTVTVHRWPADAPGSAPLGSAIVPDGEILGTIRVRGEDRLMVRQPSPEALHALFLPDLSYIRATGITRSPAAAAFASGPVAPFVGMLPGGGPDDEAMVIFQGRIMPVDTGDDAPFPPGGTEQAPAEAGAQPIGLVGDGSWLALLHTHLPAAPLDPVGGALAPPIATPASAVSLVPFDQFVGLPEEDDGHLDPPVSDAVTLDERGTLAVGSDGFIVRLEAQPAARVYVAEADPSVVGSIRIVPESGSLDVRILPQPVASGGRQRVSMAVVSPAGRSYLATWEVRLLRAPPTLRASVTTPIGSGALVEGRTAPYAEVTVAGQPVPVDAEGRFAATADVPPWPTEIVVVATDPVGNVATVAVSGVGFLDYRALPWIPIVIMLVAIAGLVLYLRVPHLRPQPRAAGDDSALEEIDPD
ncbi:MAG TPA: hypothetical protein VFW95_12075 [Candidatus Limnocylindria bacterium]|nr:hypothetical protein [Candidatus Limnocylindria bacterium]